MCLNIKFYKVSRSNHRAIGLERFYSFLNHDQTVSCQERGTSKPFVYCGDAAAYAWNASTIEGTNLPQSIHVIGFALKFPLDVSFKDARTVVNNCSHSVVGYLQIIQGDVEVSCFLVGWLMVC